MNQVTLIGRLTKDQELRYLSGSGTANCTFTLAVDRGMSKEKKAEAQAKGNPTCDFPRVVTWGKTAENCANFLAKGRLVAVQGSIQTSTYKTPQGETRYSTDVNATHVEFLEWGDKKEEKTAPFEEYSSEFEQLDESDFPEDIPF